MLKSLVKYEADILVGISKLFEQKRTLIITCDDVISVLEQFYSKIYLKREIFSHIIDLIESKNIAKYVEVNLPEIVKKKLKGKNIPSVFVKASVPIEDREKLVLDFIKAFVFTSSNSIPRPSLVHYNETYKMDINMDSYDLDTRAMYLHLFLISNYGLDLEFKLTQIKSITLRVVYDICVTKCNNDDSRTPRTTICPNQDMLAEISDLILYLSPPSNELIVNDVLKKTVFVEVKELDVSVLLDFSESNSHYIFWKLKQYSSFHEFIPPSVNSFYANFLLNLLDPMSITNVPFFPREVEGFAKTHDVPPTVLGSFLPNYFQKRLESLGIQKSVFIDSKLYLQYGTPSLIIRGFSLASLNEFDFLTNMDDDSIIDLGPNIKSNIFEFFVAAHISKNGFLMKPKYGLLQRYLNKILVFERSKNIATEIKRGSNFESDFEKRLSRMLYKKNLSGFNLDDECIIVNAKELIKIYSNRAMIRRFKHSIAVAIEFLKVSLSPYVDDQRAKLRQISHLNEKDIQKAFWYFNTTKLMKKVGDCWFIKYPKFEIINFKVLSDLIHKEVFSINTIKPHTLHIFITFDNESLYDIVWDGMSFINEHFSYSKYSDEFKTRFFYSQYRFFLEYRAYALPGISHFSNDNIDMGLLNKKKSVNSFLFGAYNNFQKYDTSDLLQKYLLCLISNYKVDGIGLNTILKPFKNDKNVSYKVMKALDVLLFRQLIIIVPSSNIEPHYSSYVSINSIVNHDDNFLIYIHSWILPNGVFSFEIYDSFRKSISFHIFCNEFINFEDLMDEFYYISPYDLCLLLSVLEADDVIISQYFRKSDSTIFSDEKIVPISPPSVELFLSELDQQIKDKTKTTYIVRYIKTHPSSLFNACL